MFIVVVATKLIYTHSAPNILYRLIFLVWLQEVRTFQYLNQWNGCSEIIVGSQCVVSTS